MNGSIGGGLTAWLRVVGLALLMCAGFVAPAFGAGAKLPNPIVLMWQVDRTITDEELQEMKRGRVNIIQSFGLVRWKEDEIKGYLDRAQRHSLPVIVSLWQFLQRTGPLEWDITDEGIAFINKWKSHPAIAVWHTFDEPREEKRKASGETQEGVYRKVKAADPTRPVMVSLNLTQQAEYDVHFNERAFDMVDLHAYMYQKISDAQKRLVGVFKANRRGNYPVIITMRAFDGGQMKPLGPMSLQEQYDFFIRQSGVTRSYGFYGWDLGPTYRGIKQIPAVKEQFLSLRN